MPGFCGRLTPAADPYFTGDAVTPTLFCIPETGATWPIVNALGTVADIPFLSGPTVAAATYDVSGLGACQIFDVWATEVSGAAVMGLAQWCRNYGSGTYSSGGYGLAPQIFDTPYYGIPVNSAPITLRLTDGSSPVVAQYRATFLGSIRIANIGGKIICRTSYGEAREWGIWNRHNQKRIVLKGGDTTMTDPNAVFVYSPTWAPVFGDLNAYLKVFSGRPCLVDTKYCHNTWLQEFAGYSSIIQGAVGWGSRTVPSGFWFQRDCEGYTGPGAIMQAVSLTAHYDNAFSCGLTEMYGLVKTQGIAAASRTNDGTSVMCMGPLELRMLLTAEWMG